MEISGETLLAIATVVTGGGSFGAYILARVKRQDHERAAAETRCHAENDKLVARLVLLEDRAHQEDREDRAVLLRTVENSSQAFRKLADRIPEIITPAKGTPLVSSIRPMAAVLFVLGTLLLCGCIDTRSATTTDGELVGTIDGKPVRLTYNSSAATVSHAEVDTAAIGKAVGEAVAAAVKTAVPGAQAISDAIKSSIPTPPADDGGVKAIAGALGGTTLAGIIAAMLKSREASRHRDDADAGWNLALAARPAPGVNQ